MNEKEYCYDANGRQLEVGPSMKDGPMGVHVISCPICRACLNQVFLKEEFELKCSVLGDIPEDIDQGNIFCCSHYAPDENSFDYELVKKLMENETNN